VTRRRAFALAVPVAAGLAAVLLGWGLTGEAIAQAWLLAFVVAAGLAAGSLGLLMIGHLLGEVWLAPVRSELEAAALTLPLVALLGLPLAAGLEHAYPWAAPGAMPAIPPARALYLSPPFLLLRGAAYLAVWTALALWIAREGEHRAASAVGLVLLMPTLALAGVDWVMSRDPRFWSGAFGLAFGLSQLLAALSGAILVSILRFEHPSPERLGSLERALLALTLMTLWAWFVQFLIVWLANLPEEAAWYLARETGGWRWLMLAGVLPALFAAILILIPPGIGRATIALGSGLLLLAHTVHMAWLVRPAGWGEGSAWGSALALAGAGAVWAAWFGAALLARPSDAERERAEGHSPLAGPTRPPAS